MATQDTITQPGANRPLLIRVERLGADLYRAEFSGRSVQAHSLGAVLDAVRAQVEAGPDEYEERDRLMDQALRRRKGERLLRWFALWSTFERYSEGGLFIYYSAIGGLAAFWYFGISPVWLGFVAGWIPASLLAALAYASDE